MVWVAATKLALPGSVTVGSESKECALILWWFSKILISYGVCWAQVEQTFFLALCIGSTVCMQISCKNMLHYCSQCSSKNMATGWKHTSEGLLIDPHTSEELLISPLLRQEGKWINLLRICLMWSLCTPFQNETQLSVSMSTEMGSIAWDNCDTVAMSWKIHLCTGLMMICLFDVFWEYESIREFFLWWLACVGPQYIPIYISGIGIFCTSSGKPTQAHPKTPFFLTWTWKWTKWKPPENVGLIMAVNETASQTTWLLSWIGMQITTGFQSRLKFLSGTHWQQAFFNLICLD